jgi:hypothetical protein
VYPAPHVLVGVTQLIAIDNFLLRIVDHRGKKQVFDQKGIVIKGVETNPQ